MFPFVKQLQIIVVPFVLEFHFYHFYDFSVVVSCHLLQLSACHHELIYCIILIIYSSITLVGKPENHMYDSYLQSMPREFWKEEESIFLRGNYRSFNEIELGYFFWLFKGLLCLFFSSWLCFIKVSGPEFEVWISKMFLYTSPKRIR